MPKVDAQTNGSLESLGARNSLKFSTMLFNIFMISPKFTTFF